MGCESDLWALAYLLVNASHLWGALSRCFDSSLKSAKGLGWTRNSRTLGWGWSESTGTESVGCSNLQAIHVQHFSGANMCKWLQASPAKLLFFSVLFWRTSLKGLSEKPRKSRDGLLQKTRVQWSNGEHDGSDRTIFSAIQQAAARLALLPLTKSRISNPRSCHIYGSSLRERGREPLDTGGSSVWACMSANYNIPG